MIHVTDLSPGQRRLLRLFQAINFGRIEELEVRGGEPQFSPLPRVFVELKLVWRAGGARSRIPGFKGHKLLRSEL